MSKHVTNYFVERFPNDTNRITCSSSGEAIRVANEVSGTAWKHNGYSDRFGCPCNSYQRYNRESGTWEYQ